jgi:hypothetical protein
LELAHVRGAEGRPPAICLKVQTPTDRGGQEMQ